MPLTEANRIPTATFRVQLNAEFTFRQLEAQVGYLRSLGISDFYLSPIFTAQAGSTHGYDVNDYTRISDELGGSAAFERLADQVKEQGGGLLVDLVPNHMGIAGDGNAWWQEVLEFGPASDYAPFFDIDWQAAGGRVLLPILEHRYGRELEAGKLSVRFAGQRLGLGYGEIRLPLRPASQAEILRALAGISQLTGDERAQAAAFADQLAAEPDRQRTRKLELQVAEWRATRPGAQDALEVHLRRLNGLPGNAPSLRELDALIDRQHYRLVRWKAGVHEINYRRFFAIASLVGLRMENPAVFRETHRLLETLLKAGRVTGLRIDHIDGLREPEDYLRRLQGLARPAPDRPLYVVVEKILAPPDETLPDSWPVQGTTGYEFIFQVAGLLVDPAAEARITATYRRFTGESATYQEAVYAAKRLVLTELFADAVSKLGAELAELVARDWQWQDMTRHELIVAVRELMAGLPVYRTYRESTATAGATDRAVLAEACRRAVERNSRLDPQPFEFLRSLLAGDYPRASAPADYKKRLAEWVLTFQQNTGAVMAKAVEDTAFYTYGRFIALNEVGGNPGIFGAPVQAFHAHNLRRLQVSPHMLLTTCTHDTKFSEDVRARLYALAELADGWDGWVERWHGWNRSHRTATETGPAPDRLDEQRFYQVLLGAWPLDVREVDDAFRARLREHFRKAVEEAKRHTSALRPNERYLAACDGFVDRTTSPVLAAEFLADFVPAAERVAGLGMMNSLTQLVLKCTVPGVPDFYQGNEIWDFSLVDPDNRRPIDQARRTQLHRGLAGRSPAELLEQWRDGGIKMQVMQTLLQFRAAEPALFQRGTYEPRPVHGSQAAHAIAFLRRQADRALLVVVPRLTAGLGSPPIGEAWGNTAVTVETPATTAWRDLLTGEPHRGGRFPLSQLLRVLPFATLARVVDRGESPP